MEPHPPPAAPPRRRSLGCFWWALVALVIIGYSGMAVYRLKDDAATVASVTITFWISLALFCCILSLKEGAAAGSAWRDRLKAFLYVLFTLLYLHLAYMAMGTAALTLRVALLAWFIPAAAWAAFFLYAFFNRGGRFYLLPDETMLLPPV